MKRSNNTRTAFVFGVSILLLSLLMSCSTMTQAERDAKRAELANYVAKVMDDRHYTIDINTIYTQRFGSETVANNWSLEVRGDTLISYLPYFGIAYEASFGNNSGLDFKATISTYKDSGFVKGKRSIQLTTRNDDDYLEYFLDVRDNGSAYISVMSRKRDNISYSGSISEK